jgi:hypothetical protein
MKQISVAQDKGDDSWKTACKDIAIPYLSLKHNIFKEFTNWFCFLSLDKIHLLYLLLRQSFQVFLQQIGHVQACCLDHVIICEYCCRLGQMVQHDKIIAQ